MLGGEDWEEIKCGILMNGIIALIKGIPKNSLTLFLYHVRKQWEDLWIEPSPYTESAGTLVLEFPAHTAMRNTFCCLSHPVYALLEQLELTDCRLWCFIGSSIVQV